MRAGGWTGTATRFELADGGRAYEEKCLEAQGYTMSDPTPVGDQGLWEACAMIALRDGT